MGKILYFLPAAILGAAPFLVPPPQQSTSTLPVTAQCTGDGVLRDNNGTVGCQRVTDAAPQGLLLRPQPAFPGGTQTASNLVLVGGQDETTIVIDAWGACAGAAVTVTRYDSNGAALSGGTLTEGVNWTAATSDAATCTSLATAVDALAGVAASCSAATVRITLDNTTAMVTLSETIAGCTTVGTGTNGQALVRSGSASAPGIAFISEKQTGWFQSTTGRMSLGVGGTTEFDFSASFLNARQNYIYDSLDQLNLGGTCSDGHSQGTGDVCVSGTLQVDGATHFDGIPYFYGAAAKGQYMAVQGVTQSLTFAANPGDASKVTSGLIPDGAQLMGITSRVTTTGTNCTSVSLGDGSDVDMYGATIAITSGTTTSNADATATWAMPNLAAGEVTVTANGGNCFSLVIAITAHYLNVSAATSN